MTRPVIQGKQDLVIKTRDHSAGSAPIDRDVAYYEVPEEIGVFAYSTDPPGTPNAKSTQVHLHFGKKPGPVFVIRFKGPTGLDVLLEQLQEYREYVWGKR